MSKQEVLHMDLNSDLGESFGAWKIGDDEGVLPWVTSANVAAGFHAGDPSVIRRTVARARELGVEVGAHPGFPDLVGFGRRDLAVTPDQAYCDVLYQIGAVAAFVRAQGLELQHVKPHGQLNNLAVRDRDLAEAIVAACHDFDPRLRLIAYGGELLAAAERAGVPLAREAYADRAYNPDGTLVSRRITGAVITDPGEAARRAVSLARDGGIRAVDGSWLALPTDTLCVHGDSPGAAKTAQAIRQALEEAGVPVRSLKAAG
jgi:UPF0271 protein